MNIFGIHITVTDWKEIAEGHMVDSNFWLNRSMAQKYELAKYKRPRDESGKFTSNHAEMTETLRDEQIIDYTKIRGKL